jgi:Na+/H+ antiporter NhaB
MKAQSSDHSDHSGGPRNLASASSLVTLAFVSNAEIYRHILGISRLTALLSGLTVTAVILAVAIGLRRLFRWTASQPDRSHDDHSSPGS